MQFQMIFQQLGFVLLLKSTNFVRFNTDFKILSK